jgi:beta-galactosidase
MRKVIPLNFDWKYNEKFEPEMFKKSYDDSDFISVDIPHCNKEIPLNYFDERMFQFVSCYRKSFTLPAEAYKNDRRILLHFEGAANYAIVYLNGKEVGSHKGGYTPFTFDITEFINTKENVISVMLDSTERKEIPPFGHMVDYLVYGGIYREVWLEIVEKVYIDDIFIRTLDTLASKKVIDADISFSDFAEGEVNLALFDGEKEIANQTCNVKGKKLNIKWRLPDLKLWTLDDPQLYTLKVKYEEDEKSERFGFRTAQFKRDGFYLNGEKLQLRGLNRHQSYPYVGNAMPKSAQEADALLMKNRLGCNLVRTAHYPDSIHFLNKCDEIGLLVFTEMPSWQHLGEGEWRENCLENIRKMVLRDRNHPSVILWGVRVNEGVDCDEFYTETNKLCRELDPTRQTGGVRNMPRSSLLEDVYTYNDFSHSGGKINLLPPAIVTGLTAPYLVTEYNGHMFPTKSFDKEGVRTEHALRHARVQNAAYGNKRISGAIGWCMADYNTHKDFGSGDRICYHGVTDMFRIPKLAAYVYASQQDKFPVMEISSSMDIGDHPGGFRGQVYIFTNCDYVKVYKNGKLKSVVYPNKKMFPHLAHAPMTPDDYLGDDLKTVENLKNLPANLLRDVIVRASMDGFLIPPQYYLKLAAGFLTSGKTLPQFIDLLTKYVANWGDEQITYTYEGYKDSKLVKSITKTACNSVDFTATPDSTELHHGDTYDVTRIELEAVDQNNNRLTYANNAVSVKVIGGEIIGPDKIAFIGGVRAFWVRTTKADTEIKVTIKVEGMGTKTLTLNVN